MIILAIFHVIAASFFFLSVVLKWAISYHLAAWLLIQVKLSRYSVSLLSDEKKEKIRTVHAI